MKLSIPRMTNGMATTFVAISLGVCLMPCPSDCAEQDRKNRYSVQGGFTYQVFALRREGEPSEEKPLSREFEVVVDDCDWKVTIVLVGNTQFDSFVYSGDGSRVDHYSTLPGGRRISSSTEDSPVPGTRTSAAGEYVWLAFASGCYLRGRTNDLITSFDRRQTAPDFVQRYEVPCRVSLSPVSPFLPLEILYVKTNQNSRPLPASFGTNGYVSAALKSSAFTNVNGLTIPTKFEYRKFQPMFEAKTTNDLRLVLLVSGSVTNISATAPR